MVTTPPGGLLGYVLDDENRTRRARSLLYPIAIILASAAALVVYSPIAAGAIGGLGSVAAGIRHWRSRRAT